MDKPKIIIVEAPQGGWKTTVTNKLRNELTCSNLMRLSGGKSQDSSIPVFTYYSNLLSFLGRSHNAGMNFIFDRLYFSEQVYCRMGMKNYKFDSESAILTHKLQCLQEVYDVYVILLTTTKEQYVHRLNRDKPVYENAVFSADSSMKQQEQYLDIINNLNIDHKLVIDTTYSNSNQVTKDILKFVNN